MNIENLIIDLSKNPFDAELNFNAAKEYLALNQTASAVSFFLRTAEYGGEGNDLVYASLCAIALCFDNQKGRELSVTNCLLQAIAYDPTRPEAYFLLSQFHEKAGNWQECYTFATIATHLIVETKLPIDLGYFDDYCALFQKAISAWWIGRKDESLSTLKILSAFNLNEMYRNAVTNNLEKLNALL